MVLQRIMEKVRFFLLRFPAIGYGQLPETPAYVLRDLWRGDSIHGMHLTKGEFIYQDCVIPLYPGKWGEGEKNLEIVESIHGFSWLRDLRELGTENARLIARGLVTDWISNSPSSYPVVVYQPFVLATRVSNWLGHYDFFAASADGYFHRQFMQRILMEGRYIVAMLPLKEGTHETFTLLKGAMGLALCMPEQFDLIPKISKYLQIELARQIFDDGIHVERNPEIQLSVLRDLVEIRLMYQMVMVRPPSELIMMLDKISKALRGLRHGDGRLALFNGASEGDAEFMDCVLSHSTQQRVAMTDMKQGGYIRCYANRSTLLIDSGGPAEKGAGLKHLGELSFEFSLGKQRIIVNCGAGGSSAWQSALAGTAAHSVLKLNDSDAVLMRDNRLADPDFKIEARHEVSDAAHWVELSHNGWEKKYGVVYTRQFYLSADGQDLRGKETIEGDKGYPFRIRFHLHPSVKVEEKVISVAEGKEERIFVLSFHYGQEGRQIWWFRFSGAEGHIEDSVYFGQKVRLATKQIVLYNCLHQNENGLDKVEIPLKEKQASVKQEQKEEDSAYVAIFHNQDYDSEMREDSVPDGVSEVVQEPDEKVQNSPEIDPASDEGVEGAAFAQGVEEDRTVVQWALRRKA